MNQPEHKTTSVEATVKSIPSLKRRQSKKGLKTLLHDGDASPLRTLKWCIKQLHQSWDLLHAVDLQIRTGHAKFYFSAYAKDVPVIHIKSGGEQGGLQRFDITCEGNSFTNFYDYNIPDDPASDSLMEIVQLWTSVWEEMRVGEKCLYKYIRVKDLIRQQFHVNAISDQTLGAYKDDQTGIIVDQIFATILPPSINNAKLIRSSRVLPVIIVSKYPQSFITEHNFTVAEVVLANDISVTLRDYVSTLIDQGEALAKRDPKKSDYIPLTVPEKLSLQNRILDEILLVPLVSLHILGGVIYNKLNICELLHTIVDEEKEDDYE